MSLSTLVTKKSHLAETSFPSHLTHINWALCRMRWLHLSAFLLFLFSSCQPTAPQEQPSSRKHSFTFGHSLIVTDFEGVRRKKKRWSKKCVCVGGGQREKNGLGMVMYVFNLSTMETEAGRALWVWGQSDLHSEFHDSQGYIKRFCLKNKPTKEKAGILTLSRRSCLIFSLNWKESTDVEKVNIQF